MILMRELYRLVFIISLQRRLALPLQKIMKELNVQLIVFDPKNALWTCAAIVVRMN